jgi:hypothetical protein
VALLLMLSGLLPTGPAMCDRRNRRVPGEEAPSRKAGPSVAALTPGWANARGIRRAPRRGEVRGGV